MPSRDDDQAPATPIEIRRDGDDDDRAPTAGRTRTQVAIVLVALVIGAAGGYLGGHRSAGDRGADGRDSPTAPVSVPVSSTGNRCAVQHGTRLQLGVEILNQSGAAVALHFQRVVLPLGGLRVRTVGWDGCGQLVSSAGGSDRTLPAAGTAWLTMTFDVLVPCPAPLPVEIALDYTQGGRAGIADMLPFPDLGDIAFQAPLCPPGA